MIRSAFITRLLGSGESWLNKPVERLAVKQVARQREKENGRLLIRAALAKGLRDAGSISRDTGLQRAHVLNVLHEMTDDGLVDAVVTSFCQQLKASSICFDQFSKVILCSSFQQRQCTW